MHEGVTADQLVRDASQRFNISLGPGILVVPLRRTALILPESYPRLTLLGQAWGAARLGHEALSKLVPEVSGVDEGGAFFPAMRGLENLAPEVARGRRKGSSLLPRTQFMDLHPLLLWLILRGVNCPLPPPTRVPTLTPSWLCTHLLPGCPPHCHPPSPAAVYRHHWMGLHLPSGPPGRLTSGVLRALPYRQLFYDQAGGFRAAGL